MLLGPANSVYRGSRKAQDPEKGKVELLWQEDVVISHRLCNGQNVGFDTSTGQK